MSTEPKAKQICTWQDAPDKKCSSTATVPQIGKDGEVWANLCDEHAAKLNEATDFLMSENRDSKKASAGILSSWIKASGGPAKMAERMMK